MSTRQPVNATPRRPPRQSLLTAAPPVEMPGWELWGVEWEPERCTGGGVRQAGCNGNTQSLDPGENAAVVAADPFVVWAADSCTLMQQGRDWRGRALRLLNATRSFHIARELWDGALAAANPEVDRLVLTDLVGDVLTGGPATTASEAIGCLEQGLAQCMQGSPGMIHLTVQALQMAASEYAVRREGSQWLTPNDHLVVADAGYTGSGPGGVAATTSQWMYATDLIGVSLGAQRTLPAEGEAPLPDLSVNTLTVYAQQWAMYSSDRCCLLAAELDLAPCLIGGVS